MAFEIITSNELPIEPLAVFNTIIDLQKWKLFKGRGPLPGIAEASLPPTEVMRLGARVRVQNTDGSVHHEVVTRFEPGRCYAIRMELAAPASWVIGGIDEQVDLEPTPGGTRVFRRFLVQPRLILTAPIAWLVTRLFLEPAVVAHDRAVAATTMIG